MQTSFSLKNLERRAFRLTLLDGLWDVQIGCFVLILAVAPVLSGKLGDFWGSFVFLPFWALVYLLIRSARAFMVAPRLGTVALNPYRKRRLRTVNHLVFVLTTLLLILTTLAAALFRDPGPGTVSIPFFVISAALVFLAGFSSAAYLLDIPHLYAYGILLFSAPLVGEWLHDVYGPPHHGFPITFGACAAVMLLAGLIKFVRLLVRFPAPPFEDN